jgi:sucrose-6F-phosphate phosphohydrolase
MEQTEPRLLLCTDLDRTLIPNGTAPEDARARKMFSRLSRHPEVTLAYVTGRDRHLVLDALEHYNLPQPDYALTDVGAMIFQVVAGDWQQLEVWTRHLSASWPEGTDARIRDLVNSLSGPLLQEEAKQNRFKVSYYIPLALERQAVMDRVQQLLVQERIPANLIWSIDEIEGVGLLDVLPNRADKRQAIRFLQQYLRYGNDEVVFAGDSGNDLQVINSDIPSILVANAATEIKQAALEWAQQNNQTQALYLARGDLLAMNGNYSAGILEGICHFQPAYKSYLTRGAV